MSSGALRTEAVAQEGSLSALKHSAFRWYFAGQLVSVSGTWMQAIAQQVVVYELTKSELALGLVACAQGLPALILTPFAGVLVERYPRRTILVGTQTFMMILAFILAYLQFANVLQVWHLVVLSLGIGVANALDAPARQAFVVEMVGKEHLASGIVLNAIMFNGARIIGPALGGLALKAVGPAWCFFLNGASFIAVIIGLIVMTVPHVQRLPGRILIIQPLKEGYRFARSHPAIWPILILSAVTSTFGLTFSTVVPAFADQVLHDTQLGTAALNTAQGIGAVLAGVAIAWANNRGRRGQFMASMALAAPISVLIFAFSTSLLSSLPLVGFAGFGFISQYVLMNTLIQTQVPDELRARVLSLYTLTFMGLNPFGSLAIGVAAQAVGTVPALLLYGAIDLIGVGLVVWRAPQLWKIR
jgi:MFS family permease